MSFHMQSLLSNMAKMNGSQIANLAHYASSIMEHTTYDEAHALMDCMSYEYRDKIRDMHAEEGFTVGGKIRAIKAVREDFGGNLAAAKMAVEFILGQRSYEDRV